MRKIIIIIILLISAVLVSPAQAADISNLDLSLSSTTKASQSVWTVSFTVPEDTEMGFVIISFGGYRPDASRASLGVSGLEQGTAKIGKSVSGCAYGCDDVTYYFDQPIDIEAGTEVTFVLNNMINPSSGDKTGIEFIDVYDTKYPQKNLAYSSSNKYVDLTGEDRSILDDASLIPSTTTDESDNEDIEAKLTIDDVELPEKFFKNGSKTTELNKISNPEKAREFTLDVVGVAKLIFIEPIDITLEDNIKALAKIDEYISLVPLSVGIEKEFAELFNVDIEITFYDIPYISDPDILIDGQVADDEQVDNFFRYREDNKSHARFITKEYGQFDLVPRLELNFKDGLEVEDPVFTVKGVISDPSAQLLLKLNDEFLSNQVEINQLTGEFYADIELNSRENLIEVIANSDYGPVLPESRQVKLLAVTEKPSSDFAESPRWLNPLYLVGLIILILVVVLLWVLKYLKK